MKVFRRIVSIVMIMALCVCCAACSKKSGPDNGGQTAKDKYGSTTMKLFIRQRQSLCHYPDMDECAGRQSICETSLEQSLLRLYDPGGQKISQ